MKRIMPLVVVFVCLAVFATASWGEGVKLLCITKQDLKGEESVASCLARGEEFAVVDDNGLVRILSPREVALTKAFNSKVLEMRAYGWTFREMAPVINPLKRRAIFGPGQ